MNCREPIIDISALVKQQQICKHPCIFGNVCKPIGFIRDIMHRIREQFMDEGTNKLMEVLASPSLDTVWVRSLQ